MTTGNVEPSAHPALDRWYAGARLANVVLGLWLFTSAFVWHHFEGSRNNTCVVGALIVACSVAALRHTAWRRANTVLAGWLVVSTLMVFHPYELATMWNNLLVAGVVCALSLVTRGDQGGPAPV